MWPRSGDDSGDASGADAIIWRGADHGNGTPRPQGASGSVGVDHEWPDDPDDPWADDHDGDDEPLRRRSGLRTMAVLGAVGFVFAATIVTGSGGGGERAVDPPDTGAEPTDEAEAANDAPVERTDAGADPAASERPDVDLGLSYGGAGGGADIRDGDGGDEAGDGADTAVESAPTGAEPLIDPALLPRLPGDVDTVDWAVTLSAASMGVDPDADPVVEVSVLDDVVVATASVAGSVAGSGGESGQSDPAPAEVGRATVVVLDAASGEVLDVDVDAAPGRLEAIADAVAEQARQRSVPTVELSPDVIARRGIVPAPDADELTRRAVEQVAAGEMSVLAAEEVADGRIVAFLGDRLLGIRPATGDLVDTVDGAPFVADWLRAGVLVGLAASDRGALLLLSDMRSTQQATIDAVTGATVTELNVLAWSEVYVTAANGVVVRRPAAVGSAYEAVGLDGQTLWQLVGEPVWAIGDGIVVTAAIDASGLTIEARR